jgi:serine phosphatase RsbU (regulator of sigma subunit)
MPGHLTSDQIQKWAEVILNTEADLIQELTRNCTKYKKILVDQITLSIYQDLGKLENNTFSPWPMSKEFEVMQVKEKAVWYEFASGIPYKLKSLNLFIRPFRNFCRTCIITDDEIEKLARRDHEQLFKELSSEGWKKGKATDTKNKISPVLCSFNHLPENAKRFFLELNYLIPAELKKAGFEIIRAEELAEINDKMVKKIARAIHSRYLHEMTRHETKTGRVSSASGFYSSAGPDDPGLSDFDDLPDEIKYSNTDNAYHIPTKLLAIGYKIRPAGKGYNPVALHLNAKEVETMARVEHIRWSWDKRLNGWTYGRKRDNVAKKHPGLLPYEYLKESEKEKDRELVRLIPSLLKDIGYVAFPVNPSRIKNLSYAIKPQSSIHRILEETSRMNSHIRGLVKLTPELNEMIDKRNRKIEEAINEVEESYNYARHIQETFLPDNLYVRECFPESFILYKPKDIVSGDFYFFSKQDNIIIFAVADCTGHGIPGALISTIGYGILDQAVNEVKLTDPSAILEHLYSRIHIFLRNEEGSGLPDDMDIVLGIFDSETNVLSYSGVRNPFYRITHGKLIEYRANISSDELAGKDRSKFNTSAITLKRGDMIYMFSDGYTDQFGGSSHKKYQTGKLRSFLLSINNRPMAEQGDLLFEEIEKWREEKGEDQTDDILVIGITI